MPYLPHVQDRDGSLWAHPEEIKAGMSPDTSLADVIRRFIREGIDRHNQQYAAKRAGVIGPEGIMSINFKGI